MATSRMLVEWREEQCSNCGISPAVHVNHPIYGCRACLGLNVTYAGPWKGCIDGSQYVRRLIVTEVSANLMLALRSGGGRWIDS